MALKMPSPVKDRHGTYYLRRRVPKDLLAHVGRPAIRRSLETKNAAEAKLRMTRALADLDAEWANYRSGSTTLTEREAHDLARPLHDELVARFIDNPSLRDTWFEHLYERVWFIEWDDSVFEDQRFFEDANLFCMMFMYSISFARIKSAYSSEETLYLQKISLVASEGCRRCISACS